MGVQCWLLLAASICLAPEALLSPLSDDDLTEHLEGVPKGQPGLEGDTDLDSQAVELPLTNKRPEGGGDPDVEAFARVAGAYLPEHASSLVSTNSSDEQGKSGTGVWRCYNYCVSCNSGVAWQISRAQPTGRKIAKYFVGVAVGSVVATLTLMTGPLLGWAGLIWFGLLALTGTGFFCFVAGLFIGLASLISNIQDRACPVVGFAELLPANSGLLSGIATEYADGWRQMIGSQPHEQRYSLADLNYYELLLRLPGTDEKQLAKKKTTLIRGQRHDIPAKERLRMAIACNLMTFDKKMWTEQRRKTHQVSKAEEARDELAIVKECGEWLCNGENSVASATAMGFFSRCRARTFRASEDSTAGRFVGKTKAGEKMTDEEEDSEDKDKKDSGKHEKSGKDKDDSDKDEKHSKEDSGEDKDSDKEDSDEKKHSDKKHSHKKKHSDKKDSHKKKHSDEKDSHKKHSDEKDSDKKHSDKKDSDKKHSDEKDSDKEHSDEKGSDKKHSHKKH